MSTVLPTESNQPLRASRVRPGEAATCEDALVAAPPIVDPALDDLDSGRGARSSDPWPAQTRSAVPRPRAAARGRTPSALRRGIRPRPARVEASTASSKDHPPKKRTEIRRPEVAKVSRRSSAAKIEARVFSSAQTAARPPPPPGRARRGRGGHREDLAAADGGTAVGAPAASRGGGLPPPVNSRCGCRCCRSRPAHRDSSRRASRVRGRCGARDVHNSPPALRSHRPGSGAPRSRNRRRGRRARARDGSPRTPSPGRSRSRARSCDVASPHSRSIRVLRSRPRDTSAPSSRSCYAESRSRPARPRAVSRARSRDPAGAPSRGN